MKRTGFIIVTVFIALILTLTRQQYNISASENHREEDSVYTQPIPEPLDIAEIITGYDSLLSAEILNTGTVGAAVAIVYKNQIAFLKCFGVKKAGTNDSIDQHTLFRLASVSKSITGVLAGMLASENIVSLDEKVTEYLPGFRLKTREATESITVCDLLRHTTGLTAHAYDDLVEQKIPLAKIMESLPLANIVSSPGQLYAYQNVMFSLYDTIVAAKTGKNYSNMLNEKIFGPFSMNDASTGFSAFKDNNNKALPHTGSDKYFRVTSLNDRYYNTLPAAGVNASISDMANFLLALLNDSLGSWNKNVEEMIFTPQIESILARSYFSQWDPVESKEYGIGWRLVGYKGRKVAYHGGFVKGYRAEVALCKEENAGIVFLSNSPCSIAAKAVPMFLNPLFELKDNQKLANDPHKTANPPNKS